MRSILLVTPILAFGLGAGNGERHASTLSPDSILVLAGGRYLDVRAGVLRDNGAIVLSGGRIVAVHAPADHWHPPDSAVVRRADGQTILPGLIDAHVHLTLAGDPAANATATLRAGFTTVIDLGSVGGGGMKLRDAIAAGRVPGPRMIAAGSWIGAKGGVCEFGGATVSSEAEAGARARSDIEAGADLIKVCVTGWAADAVATPDSVEAKAPLLAAIVRVAGTSRRPVYAHAIGRAGALLAVQYGVRALAHTPVVDSTEAARIVQAGVFVISTLATLTQGPGGDQVRQSFQRLHRAGARIVLGTDAGVLAHGRNAAELLALTEAGLSPIEALRAATLTPAALLGSSDAGEISVGARADLLLVAGDPLQDITVTTRPSLVVKAGRIVH
jgi:imidazolonepropionase-like amidohydrolase